MYQLQKFNSLIVAVKRISDSVSIPMDTANSDYQAFLAWKAEGNEPLPAEQE
jgi:hypothetical protein